MLPAVQKKHSRKQRNSLRYDRSQNPSISSEHDLTNSFRYDRSQNPPISSEHDLTYDVITPWPVTSGDHNFQDICQIDKCEDTESLIAIQRVLRDLFTKKTWGSVRSPPPFKCEGLSLLVAGGCFHPLLRSFWNISETAGHAEILWLFLKLNWAYYLKISSW